MNRFMSRIPLMAFTIAALTSATSCSLMQKNDATAHFSGEGKCPMCGTIFSNHHVQQTSTVDKSFLKEILAKDYSIKQYDFEPKRMVWKDDSITTSQESLVPFFKSTNIRGNKSILPMQAMVTDHNNNDLYLYFTEDAKQQPLELRLRLQYYADDPLEYNHMVFQIDGFDYEFTPLNIARGQGEGINIWEQSDDPLRTTDKDLVYAMSHCEHWAQVKLNGADGMTHVKLISKDQIESFKRTVQLYLLRGGSFN